MADDGPGACGETGDETAVWRSLLGRVISRTEVCDIVVSTVTSSYCMGNFRGGKRVKADA